MKSFFMILMVATVSWTQQFSNGVPSGLGMSSSMFGQNCGQNSGLSLPMLTQQQKTQPSMKANKEDLAEIKSLNKEKSQKKKELQQAQRDLQNLDANLRTVFDTTAYDFIKEHFDSDRHCQDYKGYEEKGKNSSLSFPNNKIARDWPQLCDVENNLQGQLKVGVCDKTYLLKGNGSSCASVISQYPASKHKVDALKKEIEDIESQVTSLKENIKADQESAGADGGLDAETVAKDVTDTEAGVCLECMRAGSSPGGRSVGSGSNLSSLLTNSMMAMMAYSSTNNFYSSMSDKNSASGFPTALPNTSPIMAASPYLQNIFSSSGGMGNSNCGVQFGQQNQQAQQMPTLTGMSMGSGSSMSYQLQALGQRLPYIQSPYTINSSLYYGNTGLNSSYGNSYNSFYGR